ncbi:uncharacterized protein LOC119672298 isoform X2 [Teleopsis dalmanni]|uniref:uncharacterized protein LOC119672298 isoform X2 n=1 Tax=Teleopsis dalmanni TaxID=139649 RepID=UPI0018CEDFA6|nr:uncharacterized protein LOC119672298 isoform X2 [Teleopsis dalmanni]
MTQTKFQAKWQSNSKSLPETLHCTVFRLVQDCTYLLSKMEFFKEWLSHAKHERCKKHLLYMSQKFDLSDITEESTRDL